MNNKERELLNLISYMVTSARGLIDEPKIYGPFRMIDSVSRLYNLLEGTDIIEENFDKKINKVISKIEKCKYECMEDEDKFIESLDDVIDNLVDVLKEDL